MLVEAVVEIPVIYAARVLTLSPGRNSGVLLILLLWNQPVCQKRSLEIGVGRMLCLAKHPVSWCRGLARFQPTRRQPALPPLFLLLLDVQSDAFPQLVFLCFFVLALGQNVVKQLHVDVLSRHFSLACSHISAGLGSCFFTLQRWRLPFPRLDADRFLKNVIGRAVGHLITRLRFES